MAGTMARPARRTRVEGWWWYWAITVTAAVVLAGLGIALAEPAGAAPPPVTLTDQFGQTVTLADLRGRPVVLTFLYSYCPDTCPMTLGAIAAGLNGIEAAGEERPAVVIVTVDPDRDTVERLRAFAGAWPADWRFLTGTYPQLTPVWRAYGVSVQKRPLAHSSEVHSGYAIVHTNKTVLLDRGGALTGQLTGAWTGPELAATLRTAPGTPPAAWQRLADRLDAFLRACGEFAAAEPGLAAGIVLVLLIPGLLLPFWLLRQLLDQRRPATPRTGGRR
ncbi:MAG: SCO family protein [Chloroflexi bacterium]|nr:SCO family protein [Chloroflexota bacterium]